MRAAVAANVPRPEPGRRPESKDMAASTLLLHRDAAHGADSLGGANDRRDLGAQDMASCLLVIGRADAHSHLIARRISGQLCLSIGIGPAGCRPRPLIARRQDAAS